MAHVSAHSGTNIRHQVSPRFTRRVLAKATAGFAAAAAITKGAPHVKSTIAKGESTVAGEWVQPEEIGHNGEAVDFTADAPFRAIAPHWPGDSDVSAAVEISVSADGVTYTDPVIVGPSMTDAGPPDREGRIFGQLMMTEEAQHVRYRTLDANGNPIRLPGLTFAYIDASAGPGLDDVVPVAFGGELTRPPIITRDQWGASLAYGGWDAGTSNWTAEYQKVEHIIIHHSETPSFRDPLVEIRSIHYYHAVTRGWGDIGYNYLVDYLGNVFEGRKGGENVVGGHSFQYAYGSAGVCSMGSFSLESSTPEAIGALVWVCAWAGRNLDPLGRKDFHETPNCPTICGHRDVNSSSCPGDSLYADLPYIRWATAEVLAGSRDAGVPRDFAPSDVIQTTVDGANLRSKPATDGSIETTLPIGTVMTIIEGPTTNDGFAWYRVSGQVSAGWLASTTFGPSSSPPPSRQYSQGSRIEVASDLLNLRSEPGLYGSIVATLPNGDVATVVDGPELNAGLSWLKVDSNLGTGWVAEQYVAPSGRTSVPSAFTVGDQVSVATDRLNMRTDASTNASVIAQLDEGTAGTVVGGPRRAGGLTWLEIRTEYGTGWVAEQYLSEGTAPPPSSARFAPGDEITVDTDALNLRSAPGLDSRVVAILWTGDRGTILDGPVSRDNYHWYQIESGDDTGWVVETFIADAGSSAPPASGFEPGTQVSVTTDALNLRESADTTGRVLTVLYHGDTGTVAGGSVSSDGYTWVLVDFDGVVGWVATTYIGRGTGAPAYDGDLRVGARAEVMSDNLNVRPNPSLSSSVNGQLFAGDVVDIVDGPVQGDGYTWFEVESATWSGWTVDVWLSPQIGSAIADGSSVRVFDGELNLRSGPSTSDDIIGVLPDGAIVEVLDGPETSGGYDWYRVSSSRYGTGWAVSAWLQRV
ncbi:MAG TPA: SH3 domain-containing protein [Thermomicrobiales bacterium]|nr:SH3 domain-containing protein [Thermomicrobiales bacterium]